MFIIIVIQSMKVNPYRLETLFTIKIFDEFPKSKLELKA